MKLTNSILRYGLIVGLLSINATFLLAQQDCAGSQAAIDISGNSLKATLLNGGDMFWDFIDGGFNPEYNGPNSPSTIFSSALWMGGVDPGGNIIVKAQNYRLGGANAYWPGPLMQDGTSSATDCLNWDRHFKVTSSEIKAFLADFQDDGILQEPHNNIKGWPAKDNPFFEAKYGFSLPSHIPLAPFMDINTDGIYNPEDGDFPIVYVYGQAPITNAAEIVFQMFNAASGVDGVTFQTLPMIIQQLSFTIACQEDIVLDNSLFTQFKLIYMGSETLSNFRFGIWNDFDLGCHLDDYLGSDPDLQTIYVYNTDAEDNLQCQGIPSFGLNPPVQAMTFLNSAPFGQKMDVAMPYFNPISSLPSAVLDPNTELDYYNLLNGRWKDGTPMTKGGYGYNPGSTDTTTFAFSGDPTAMDSSWTNADFGGFLDTRILGSVNFGTIEPGAINQIDVAWTYHRSPNATNLENVTAMKADIPRIKTAFENSFSNISCTTSSEEKIKVEQVSLSPNPASDVLFWKKDVSEQIERVQFFDAAGCLMKSISPIGNEIQISELPQGLYVVHLISENRVQVGKVIVQR